MIDTLLFDLDGTLARFHNDDFLKVYFTELGKVFGRLGLDVDSAVKGVWAGTKAMIFNDGAKFNTHRFWNAFSIHMSLDEKQLKAVEAACDDFYSKEFNKVESIVKHSEIPKQLIRTMAARGYYVVLATNPLFPPCAVDSRLGWIGLDRHDFKLITHYENSSFSKPNLDYYREILIKINKAPEQCLMIGNTPAEDMCAGELGMAVFLVTDFMENEAGMDIAAFKHGTIDDLKTYLLSLPDLS